MHKLADLVEKNAEVLASVETWDNGNYWLWTPNDLYGVLRRQTNGPLQENPTLLP